MTQPDGRPSLDRYIDQSDLRQMIVAAKAEDMGPEGLDITSSSMLTEGQRAEAVITSRQQGVLAGGALLPTIVAVYDPTVTLRQITADGQRLEAGSAIARLAGPLASILAMERVALNFMTHMCGIASLTGRYVAAVKGVNNGKTRVFDTRKTLPGLRAIQKYAVVCGGGHNQRQGLHDAVLVKDNHIAHLSPRQLPEALENACRLVAMNHPSCGCIEVEIDTLEQLNAVLGVASGRIDVVLLDNMKIDQLREAVSLRDRSAPDVELEASGGVTLETVAAIAATGVDRVSVGQITHSPAALDLALDIPATGMS